MAREEAGVNSQGGLGPRRPQHLLGRRLSRPHQPKAIVSQRAHPLLRREPAQFPRAPPPEQLGADAVVQR